MLYVGAEWLVGGASRLSLSPLFVGLAFVAYGTSANGVIVGVQAARAGHGDVAIGNVLGSNIANLGLILGIATLVRPPTVAGSLRRRELPVLLLATAALPLVLRDGAISRLEAALLLGAAIVCTGLMIRSARASVRPPDDARATATAATEAGAPAVHSRPRSVALVVIGLAVLLLGGDIFVAAATNIARAWGMSERVIGLTIAIGTSLPSSPRA